VHSQDNQQQLQELIGKNKDIHVFPHGIITHAQPKADKQSARENLSIAQDSKVLLAYGNIRAYKGLRLLLQALHELIQQDHTYHLIIAGQCREDRSYYQNLIDKFNLQNHITRIDKFVSEQESAIIF